MALGSSATYGRIGFGLFSHMKSALLAAIFGIAAISALQGINISTSRSQFPVTS